MTLPLSRNLNLAVNFSNRGSLLARNYAKTPVQYAWSLSQTKESCETSGYYVYNEIWTAVFGEVLFTERELHNVFDRYQ